MYSPTKRYNDPTSRRCDRTGNVHAQYDFDREPSKAYRSCSNQINYPRPVKAPKDYVYSYQEKQGKCDSIRNCSKQRTGYYYGTQTFDSGMCSSGHHQTKSFFHSNVNEVSQACHNPFKHPSNMQQNTMNDFPGVIESVSSSLDNSFECSDSVASQNSNYCEHRAVAASSKTFFRYHNDCNNGYDHFTTSQYDQKCSASRGIAGATAMSNRHKRGNTNNGAVKCKMIEVAPGEFMRLRGAHETWTAIQNDFYVPCACFCCDLTLFCIQDATYVLCPDCQVVNPLEKIDGYDGGVGLGFTMKELAEWQNDIIMNRQC